MPVRRRTRRGFSLMELLIVIAIIAVLSAILFPVFAVVKHKARRTRCNSNMNQVGQALKLYAADYNNYFPSFSQSHPYWGAPLSDPQKNAPQSFVVTWDLSIQEDLRNKDILTCPDNPFGRDKRAFAVAAYCMRHVRDRSNPSITYYLGDRAENIANQSGVVLLFEKGKNLPGSWGDAMGENVRQSHGSNEQSDYSDVLFHMKGKNFLYVDGHAKWFREGTGPFLNQSGGSAPPGQTQELGQCYHPDRKAAGGDWPDPS